MSALDRLVRRGWAGRAEGPSAPPPAAGRPPAPSPYDARPWVAAYPDGVPADVDVPRVPVTRLLDDAAASFPHGTALVFLGARTTYRELREQVDALATGLLGLGVQKGDRVALVLPTCPQHVIAFFAVLRLGAVVVQHDPLSDESELQRQLADSGAQVVVCLDRAYETVAAVRPQTPVRHVVVTSLADHLPRARRLRLLVPSPSALRSRAELTAAVPRSAPVRRFVDLAKRARTPARQVPLDADQDLALLHYAAGTQVARGAMLTHHNLVASAYLHRLWDTAATAGQETTLVALPLSHGHGLTVALLTTVLLSGTLVLLPSVDVDQVLAAVDDHRPTLLPGDPALFTALAHSQQLRDHDLRSLRLCLSGPARLPLDVQRQFASASGRRLVEGHGTAETSWSTLCGPTVGPARPGSTGLPLPGTRCRLVDPRDPSRQVPVGEPGELVVAGPQVFRGYWQHPDQHSDQQHPDQEGRFTDDGYLLSGTTAVMSEDGWFTVVDPGDAPAGGSAASPAEAVPGAPLVRRTPDEDLPTGPPPEPIQPP